MTFSRARITTVRLAAVSALTAGLVALSGVVPASAASAPALTVGVKPLAAATLPSGSFTVGVNAPAGAKVKFKIDGVYLGQDTTAPYTWPVSTGAGGHKLSARWDGGEVVAAFEVGAATAAPVPAPAPAPAPAPTTPPATSGTTVRVTNGTQLTAALKAAKPGQTISLADGRYVGRFEAAASGTASAKITLTGSRAAILTTGSSRSGYGLHITGDHWRVVGVSVTGSSKGIVLDGSNHTLISGVDVGNVGAEAVHFRSNSSFGVLEGSVIHDTGIEQPSYGEGVYIGSAKSNWDDLTGGAPDRSDSVIVRGNRISNTSAEGIDVKEGTTGGTITGNTFTNAGYSGENSADSWIDLKGNGYTVSGNTGKTTRLDAIQVHDVLDGWGRGNRISGTTVQGGVPGYEVWVQSSSLGTVVACKTSGAASGLSNVGCAG